jgi:hypothetical protein
MNCEILETLYIRSNGDVMCNDDAGDNLLLGSIHPSNPQWASTAVLVNARYQHIRAALRRGQMPWPEVCGRCAFLRPYEDFSDPIDRRHLRKIQVEPSLPCRLRCPGCSSHEQVQRRPRPLVLEPAAYERILSDLRDEEFSVGEIEYCGQGEPLLHPNFPELVRLSRRYFPGTGQRLITSGNFDFHRATGDEPLDEIMVSCDGIWPESYARYRVGGDVARAIQFMRDARAFRGPPAPSVVWKYILFEWNDSPEELFAAQELAREIGVQALLFVYTHSAGRSQRYTLQNPRDLPIHVPNVATNATPIHHRYFAPRTRSTLAV